MCMCVCDAKYMKEEKEMENMEKIECAEKL